MLQALCAVAKKPVRCLRGHGDPVRIKRLANRPIKVLSATLLDKRGYVKSSDDTALGKYGQSTEKKAS